MKTLHLYLLRQILATLAMTVLVFTLVLLLGNVLKEVLPFLVSGQVSLGFFTEAVGLLIPYVLVFALPMGMLTATLLAFGRLSADQELTAVRASGISLVALITPILILSIVLSGLSAFVNMKLAPQCRTAYTGMLDRLRKETSANFLPEQKYVPVSGPTAANGEKSFYIVYVDKRKGDDLSDVHVEQWDQKNNLIGWMSAPSGHVETDPVTHNVTLKLFQPQYASEDGGVWNKFGTNDVITVPIDKKAPVVNARDTKKISDMTFSELREVVRQREELNRSRPSLDKVSPELRDEMKRAKIIDFAIPVKVQIHRMVSFSFACIGFTLIGIPLGIRAHRRETSIGVAFALVLALIYYSFIIVGGALEARAEFFPHLIIWAPNFIFQAVGGWLLWRANRGNS